MSGSPLPSPWVTILDSAGAGRAGVTNYRYGPDPGSLGATVQMNWAGQTRTAEVGKWVVKLDFAGVSEQGGAGAAALLARAQGALALTKITSPPDAALD